LQAGEKIKETIKSSFHCLIRAAEPLVKLQEKKPSAEPKLTKYY